MSESYAEFHDRLAKIYRQQEKSGRIGRKSVAVTRDGYVIVKSPRRRTVPWAGIMMVALAFFGVKGIIMAQFGPDFYSQHVARLADATKLEQAVSWTMQPDPLSRWVSVQIKSLL